MQLRTGGQVRTRRLALVLCTVALNVFFIMAATVPLGARRCQQECDALQGSCNASCATTLENGSQAQNDCFTECYSQWEHCSYSAITCAEGTGTGSVCWGCNVSYEIGCTYFPIYYCYPIFINVDCYQTATPSNFCW